jgi:hypothetical protein
VKKLERKEMAAHMRRLKKQHDHRYQELIEHFGNFDFQECEEYHGTTEGLEAERTVAKKRRKRTKKRERLMKKKTN